MFWLVEKETIKQNLTYVPYDVLFELHVYSY